MARTSIQWATVDRRPAETGGDETTYSFESLVFDAVTTHGRELTADLPERPVEDACAVTDHVIPQPRRVSFEVHVSSAIYDEEIAGSRQSYDAGSVSTRVLREDSPEDRAALALGTLQDLIDRGTDVDILGLPYGDLESYQLVSVAASQNQDTGAKLVAMIEARQRITASVSEVDAPAPSVERTRPRRDRGDQQTPEVGTEQGEESRREQAQSRWSQLADALGPGSIGGL